jgi:hypothetical protein
LIIVRFHLFIRGTGSIFYTICYAVYLAQRYTKNQHIKVFIDELFTYPGLSNIKQFIKQRMPTPQQYQQYAQQYAQQYQQYTQQ